MSSASSPDGRIAPQEKGGALAALILGGALLATGALFNLDLLSGRAIPCYRDLGTTQRPARSLWGTLGPSSTIPGVSFGQPYWGNPNFVLAYPAPKETRFLGAHLLLHVALAGIGAFFFFRRAGRSAEAALLGAAAFSLSGYTLSSTAFLNATTTIAWIPWLLLAVEVSRGGSRLALAVPLLAGTAATTLLVAGGEPALAAVGLAAAALVAASGPRGTRGRALVLLAASVAVALLVLSPWLVEVARASAFSSRRVRGFSWQEFAAVGFHPLRFLETPFPFLFGDPARLVEGGFWGFGVTQGNPPYLTSQTFGLIPLALAILFLLSPRRREGAPWGLLAAGSLLVASAPWLPGARSLYGALPFTHALRYPGKAMLAFTLAVAALAALGADRLTTAGTSERFRRQASLGTLLLAAAFAAAAAWGRLSPTSLLGLLEFGWDARWSSPPGLVLAPVVARLPLQAAASSLLLLLLSVQLRRSGMRPRLLLAAAASAELFLAARPLLPRVPAGWIETRWPLVERAASLPGRVFERAPKDLDAVRRGLFGRAPTGDLLSVVPAQLSQGWALTGTPAGLRYAFDQDPDGSYAYLTRVATDLVQGCDWLRRLKWLRASGVGSVIAGDVPVGLTGLVPLLVEDRWGIPTTLYRLESPLPGVRRVSRVFGSTSVTEAALRFERDDFDPSTDAVVAGLPPPGLSAGAVDPAARARVTAEGPDTLEMETGGTSPALLQVDRAYTPRARASVDGRETRVFATQVNLIGVPVPAGVSRVRVDLAP